MRRGEVHRLLVNLANLLIEIVQRGPHRQQYRQAAAAFA
jgi:hypothetical protein